MNPTESGDSAPSESGRIRRVYGKRIVDRREELYRPENPEVFRASLELDRALYSALSKNRTDRNFDELSAVDLGCGTGDNLLRLLRFGFEPQNLRGVDLLEDRIRGAEKRLPPGVRLSVEDARNVGGRYDLVFQFMLLSSVLSAEVRRDVAKQMWELIIPGGAIISYDFVYNNPRNPDVRRLSSHELTSLFPEAKITTWPITLAPPIARRWRHHPRISRLAASVRFVNSHRLALIEKQDGVSNLA